MAVPVLRPSDRLHDPTTVEWCSGQEVERRQHRVDQGEPGHERPHVGTAGTGVSEPPGNRREPCERCARDRSGRGDPPFGSGGRRFAVEPRQAAERPELDRLGADAEPASRECVCELVDQDRREEADHAGEGPSPPGRAGEARPQQMAMIATLQCA